MIPKVRPIAHPVSGRDYPSALCGTVAPLFTPERLDGRIDFDGIEALTDALCNNSAVSSIMIRSAESHMWSYSLEEVRDAISCVLSVARDRKPVLAGTAGIWDGDRFNRPRPAVYFKRAVDLSHWALANGAAAVVQPVPCFLEGGVDYGAHDAVVRFYEDIAFAINGPILIYVQEGLPPGYALSGHSLAKLSLYRQFIGAIYHTSDGAFLADLVRTCRPDFPVICANDSIAIPGFLSGATSSAGALAVLLPELISAAWHSLEEPDLPFTWRAQTDLLRVRELLSPWSLKDVGCALLARQGIPMAARSRAVAKMPDRPQLEILSREISHVRAAYC